MVGRLKQQTFIYTYLHQHTSVDACNEHFHDEFHRRFGGKRVAKLWGAHPVLKAQRLLSEMVMKGYLIRHREPLIEMGMGFPNWLYVYELPYSKRPPSQRAGGDQQIGQVDE